MKITHLAIWVKDLEKMKSFYEAYFGAKAGAKYVNPRKGFSSYFLSFDSDCRLEIMHKPEIHDLPEKDLRLGYTHVALSVGSKEAVDSLTERFRKDGFDVYGEPRTTGDGYYESVILDPEGNPVEITV